MSVLARIQRGFEAVTLPFFGPGGSGNSWFFRSTDESIDYRAKVNPLHLNSIVAIGIGRATSMWSSAPPIIQRRAADKNGIAVWQGVSSHWVESLLENPADYYTSTNFWAGVLIGWMTEGECFIFAPYGNTGERFLLSVLPNWQVTPKSDLANPDGRELVTYYEYRTLGGVIINIPAEYVIHIKQGFNPIDQKRGWCPLQAQFPHIYGDNAGGRYTAGLLNNFGVPSVALVAKEKDGFSDKQRLQLSEAMANRYRGEGAGRSAVIPVPVTVERMGFSPNELGLKELSTAGLERICPALGFDPMALGLPSQSKTFSNMEEANRAAWRQTIKPMKEEIGRQLTQAFFGRQKGGPGDYRVYWDFDQVRELSEDKDEAHKRVREDFKANLYPRHTALEMLKISSEGLENVYYADMQARANESRPQGPALRSVFRSLLGEDAFDEGSDAETGGQP